MKRCPRCKQTKPLTDFHRSRNTKDGRAGYCAECGTAVRKEWVRKAGGARKLVWGLDPEDLKAMMACQQGKCRVCEKPLGIAFRVDHNHTTGVVCAILCNSCNAGIGLFQESAALLKRAADYARRTGRP